MSAQTPSPVAAAEPGLELSGPAGGATGAAQHSEGAATGGGGGGEDCTAARAGAGGDNGASAPPIGDRVSGRRREGGVPTAAASMSGTAVKGAKARNSVASYLREKLAVATAGVPGRVQGGAQDQATVQTLGKEGARDETVVAVPRVRSRVVVPTGGKRAAAAPPMDTGSAEAHESSKERGRSHDVPPLEMRKRARPDSLVHSRAMSAMAPPGTAERHAPEAPALERPARQPAVPLRPPPRGGHRPAPVRLPAERLEGWSPPPGAIDRHLPPPLPPPPLRSPPRFGDQHLPGPPLQSSPRGAGGNRRLPPPAHRQQLPPHVALRQQAPAPHHQRRGPLPPTHVGPRHQPPPASRRQAPGRGQLPGRDRSWSPPGGPTPSALDLGSIAAAAAERARARVQPPPHGMSPPPAVARAGFPPRGMPPARGPPPRSRGTSTPPPLSDHLPERRMVRDDRAFPVGPIVGPGPRHMGQEVPHWEAPLRGDVPFRDGEDRHNPYNPWPPSDAPFDRGHDIPGGISDRHERSGAPPEAFDRPGFNHSVAQPRSGLGWEDRHSGLQEQDAHRPPSHQHRHPDSRRPGHPQYPPTGVPPQGPPPMRRFKSDLPPGHMSGQRSNHGAPHDMSHGPTREHGSRGPPPAGGPDDFARADLWDGPPPLSAHPGWSRDHHQSGHPEIRPPWAGGGPQEPRLRDRGLPPRDLPRPRNAPGGGYWKGDAFDRHESLGTAGGRRAGPPRRPSPDRHALHEEALRRVEKARHDQDRRCGTPMQRADTHSPAGRQRPHSDAPPRSAGPTQRSEAQPHAEGGVPAVTGSPRVVTEPRASKRPASEMLPDMPSDNAQGEPQANRKRGATDSRTPTDSKAPAEKRTVDNSRGAAGRRSAYPPTQLSGSHTATADTFGPERDSRGAPAESRGASLSTSRNESRQETRNRPASHSRSQSGKASSAGAAAAKLKPPSSSDIGHGAGTRRADGGPHFKPPSRGSLDTSSQAVASSEPGGSAPNRSNRGASCHAANDIQAAMALARTPPPPTGRPAADPAARATGDRARAVTKDAPHSSPDQDTADDVARAAAARRRAKGDRSGRDDGRSTNRRTGSVAHARDASAVSMGNGSPSVATADLNGSRHSEGPHDTQAGDGDEASPDNAVREHMPDGSAERNQTGRSRADHSRADHSRADRSRSRYEGDDRSNPHCEGADRSAADRGVIANLSIGTDGTGPTGSAACLVEALAPKLRVSHRRFERRGEVSDMGAEPSESRSHRDMVPSETPIRKEAVSEERAQRTSARSSEHHVRSAVSDTLRQTHSRAGATPQLQRPPGRPAERPVDDGNRQHGSGRGRGDDGSPSLGSMLLTPGGSSSRGPVSSTQSRWRLRAAGPADGRDLWFFTDPQGQVRGPTSVHSLRNWLLGLERACAENPGSAVLAAELEDYAHQEIWTSSLPKRPLLKVLGAAGF